MVQPVNAEQPTSQEIRDYLRGSLDLARFDAIDRWLDQQSPEVQERLLMDQSTEMASRPLLIDLPRRPDGVVFISETGAGRYTIGDTIGTGGMGIVRVVHDVTLGREIAMKSCRPRAVDEDFCAYTRRLRAFRREAAITAQLEHPAIVPVHDMGRGPHDEPAYLMKRLLGVPLSQRVERVAAGARFDLSETIDIALRIAEAMAYAHERDFVHRDLKPDNVFVGELGAISVIDWGLAAQRGDVPGDGNAALDGGSGLTRYGIGTQAWMAPEQYLCQAADPRMDVFALGGLLMALLTGAAPRPGNSPILDLSPLERRGVPRALAAVARRCLAMDPADRYADGGGVAADLRRWLSAGVTLAERPSLGRRLMAMVRTSPRVVAAVVVAMLLIAAVIASQRWSHAQHRRDLQARLSDLSRTSLVDLPALMLARREVQAAVVEHPLPEAIALEARLGAAIETQQRQADLDRQRGQLREVLNRYRQRGPWPTDAPDLSDALAAAGIALSDVTTDARVIRTHALGLDILGALVQLEKTLLLAGSTDPRVTRIPEVIRSAAPTDAWRAVGDLLARAEIDAHDLRFCQCEASERALADPQAADILLMTYGPEPRLIEHARDRLDKDAGAFWPRIVSARGALNAGRLDEAQDHALVALGREPTSLWPNLLLAYIALGKLEDVQLKRWVEGAEAANPENLEVIVLKASWLARSGEPEAALALVREPGIAAHLQYHLHHPVGHPMEASVRALVAAGVAVPDEAPELGPLVPDGQHDH